MTLSAAEYRRLIRALLEQGDHDSLAEALELANDWTHEESQNPLAYLFQGDILNRWQQKAPAKTAYQKAAELYAAQGKGIQSVAAQKLILELAGEIEEAKSRALGDRPITLPPTPLFSGLAPETLIHLLDELKRRSFREGDFICREGESGDSIYILSRGEVGVQSTGKGGVIADLATLDEGAFFGEIAYFTDQKRSASVMAKTDVEVLELQRDRLDRLTKDFPEVRAVLEQFYQERVLDSLLARSELFASLSAADRKAVAAEFATRHARAATIVLLEGDPGDTFFFIRSGEVEVFRERGAEKVLLAKLGAGDFFGELAFLHQHRRLASVRTLSDCQFLVLQRDQVENLLKAYPAMAETLERIAKKRLDYSKDLMRPNP